MDSRHAAFTAPKRCKQPTKRQYRRPIDACDEDETIDFTYTHGGRRHERRYEKPLFEDYGASPVFWSPSLTDTELSMSPGLGDDETLDAILGGPYKVREREEIHNGSKTIFLKYAIPSGEDAAAESREEADTPNGARVSKERRFRIPFKKSLVSKTRDGKKKSLLKRNDTKQVPEFFTPEEVRAPLSPTKSTSSSSGRAIRSMNFNIFKKKSAPSFRSAKKPVATLGTEEKGIDDTRALVDAPTAPIPTQVSLPRRKANNVGTSSNFLKQASRRPSKVGKDPESLHLPSTQPTFRREMIDDAAPIISIPKEAKANSVRDKIKNWRKKRPSNKRKQDQNVLASADFSSCLSDEPSISYSEMLSSFDGSTLGSDDENNYLDDFFGAIDDLVNLKFLEDDGSLGTSDDTTVESSIRQREKRRQRKHASQR